MRSPLLLFVMLANIAGAIFGFYYYRELLADSPLRYWIFIPDSPASTSLFAAAMLLLFLGLKVDWFIYAASVYVMKYGLWTLFVILFYSHYFLAPPLSSFYVTMFVLHSGMVVEPILLLPSVEKKKWHLAFVAWFLINDYLDYVVGTHPLVGYPFNDLGYVGLFSVLTSLALCALAYLGSGFHGLPLSEEVGKLININRRDISTK